MLLFSLLLAPLSPSVFSDDKDIHIPPTHIFRQQSGPQAKRHAFVGERPESPYRLSVKDWVAIPQILIAFILHNLLRISFSEF